MKTLRKLSSFVVTVMMVMAMALPAFAVDIEITGGGAGAVYQGYRILNATVEPGSGTGIAYTVRPEFETILQEAIKQVSGNTVINPDEDKILDYIDKLTGGTDPRTNNGKGMQNKGYTAGNASEIRKFADKVYELAKAANTPLDVNPTGTAGNTFTDLPQGYYLIFEKSNGTDGSTTSLVMLGTAGKNKLTIKSKDDGTVPSIQKKVKEFNDSVAKNPGTNPTNWQEHADYDINDYVPFQLQIELPENIDGYTNYTFEIKDKFSNGLTFDQADFNTEHFKMTVESETGTDVKGQFKIAWDNGTKTFTVSPTDGNLVTAYANSAALKNAAAGKKKLYVTYRAQLNTDAVIGTTGNPNEAWIKYSTDPYWNGSGSPSTPPKETPKSKVIVFTYELDILKYNNDNTKLLEGAEFKLYKWIAEGSKWVELDQPPQKIVKKGDGSLEDKATFISKGLDAGKYKLEETKHPAGYKPIKPVEFEISAEFNPEKTEVVKIIGKITARGRDTDEFFHSHNKIEGSNPFGDKNNLLCFRVINKTGGELPETGGMGTTMLYLSGAILSLGAGIVLVSRRRMNINK